MKYYNNYILINNIINPPHLNVLNSLTQKKNVLNSCKPIKNVRARKIVFKTINRLVRNYRAQGSWARNLG